MDGGPKPVRLNRSQLSVPASNARYLEKAISSPADIVMLDLEDSVSVEGKLSARRTLVEALNELDWTGQTVSIRVNAMDTPWFEDDLDTLFSKAQGRFQLLMIPKVENAPQLEALADKLRYLDNAKDVGLELQIESPLAVVNVNAIAASGAARQAESLHFGPGDYAASLGSFSLEIGGDDLDHGCGPYHFALSAIANAARAFGLRPVDGPVGDFKDNHALYVSAARARSLGFEGKWAIHPSQVNKLNDVFSPEPQSVKEAERILEAMEKAKASGRAAVSLDGRMIDRASVRQAQQLWEKAELISRQT